jgi:REP element-mobilizing transposase RayT
MGRRIETSKIFRSKKDREDFIDRLAELCWSGRWAVYVWALMPNHFHLLVRTGKEPLAGSMRRLMTGYAINFNLRGGKACGWLPMIASWAMGTLWSRSGRNPRSWKRRT